MGLLDALKLKKIPPGRPRAPGAAAKKAPARGKAGAGPGGGVGAVLTATLALRVQAADAQMNGALSAANRAGNPLNNRTQGQPESKARKLWQAGMIKYWQPGSAARQAALALQGEARIAKAQQAAALLQKAQAVFQEGLRSIA